MQHKMKTDVFIVLIIYLLFTSCSAQNKLNNLRLENANKIIALATKGKCDSIQYNFSEKKLNAKYSRENAINTLCLLVTHTKTTPRFDGEFRELFDSMTIRYVLDSYSIYFFFKLGSKELLPYQMYIINEKFANQIKSLESERNNEKISPCIDTLVMNTIHFNYINDQSNFKSGLLHKQSEYSDVYSYSDLDNLKKTCIDSILRKLCKSEVLEVKSNKSAWLKFDNKETISIFIGTSNGGKSETFVIWYFRNEKVNPIVLERNGSFIYLSANSSLQNALDSFILNMPN